MLKHFTLCDRHKSIEHKQATGNMISVQKKKKHDLIAKSFKKQNKANLQERKKEISNRIARSYLKRCGGGWE